MGVDSSLKKVTENLGHINFWEEESMAMSSISRKEYLREVRRLYAKTRTKKAKGELISNVVDITGMNRKSVIRLLHKKKSNLKHPTETRGTKTIYDEAFH
jgi:hypothetical protein